MDFQEMFTQIKCAVEKKKIYNMEHYGRRYTPFTRECMTWDYEEDNGYSDKIQHIPTACFMTVEFCSPMESEDGIYALSTYSPCRLPVMRKCLSICGETEDDKLHRHDYFEMVYVMQGRRVMQVEDRKVILKENECCIFDMNCAHRDLRTESYGIVFYICFSNKQIDTFLLNHITNHRIRDFLLIKRELKHDVSYLLIQDANLKVESIEKSIASIFEELESEKEGYERIIQVHLLRLLNSYRESNASDMVVVPKKLRGTKLFQAVARFISSNIADISLEKLCKEFHYQEDYYNRLIKKNTGVTYSEYVNSLRVEKAKNLLINTDMPVKDIMIYLGYEYHSYFYKIFQQETGLTPTEYRNQKND